MKYACLTITCGTRVSGGDTLYRRRGGSSLFANVIRVVSVLLCFLWICDASSFQIR